MELNSRVHSLTQLPWCVLNYALSPFPTRSTHISLFGMVICQIWVILDTERRPLSIGGAPSSS